MKHSLFLETEHLLLSPLGEEQMEKLRTLRNRPENRNWFFDNTEISIERQKAWFASQQAAEGDYMFAVFPKQDPTLFWGTAALYSYDRETGSYEVGRLLLDSRKTPFRGLGKELVAAVCRIGFENLDAKLLYAEVFAENERSIACFTGNGFAVAGTKELHGKNILILEKHYRIH